MGMKEEFLEKVKKHFPTFDPETDRVEINFDGGGDDFNSFYKAEVLGCDGEWECDKDRDFLFKLMDESGIFYHWTGCNMAGKIIYVNKRLFIENTNCDEPLKYADSYDDDGRPLDEDGEIIEDEDDLESVCEDYKAPVYGENEEEYDVDELDYDGLNYEEQKQKEKEDRKRKREQAKKKAAKKGVKKPVAKKTTKKSPPNKSVSKKKTAKKK